MRTEDYNFSDIVLMFLRGHLSWTLLCSVISEPSTPNLAIIEGLNKTTQTWV